MQARLSPSASFRRARYERRLQLLYLLACLRYIELNPVWAGTVASVRIPWSSYRAHSQGEANAGGHPHPLDLALGTDDNAGRQADYRTLFHDEPGLVDEIGRATNGNLARGNGSFAAQVSAALGRRAAPGKPGRPRKRVETIAQNRDLSDFPPIRLMPVPTRNFGAASSAEIVAVESIVMFRYA